MSSIDEGERMQLSIEEAAPSDAETIQQVFYKTWLATYPNKEAGISVDDIEDRFKDRFTEQELEKRKKKMESMPPNEKHFVAKMAGKVVGTCYAKRLDDRNQLQTIYVLPEYQGSGIGSALWKQAANFFDPTKDTYVEVAVYNKGAIDFYSRIGFVDTGRRFSDPKFVMKSGATFPEMEMCRKASAMPNRQSAT